jgi:hypothetical protein
LLSSSVEGGRLVAAPAPFRLWSILVVGASAAAAVVGIAVSRSTTVIVVLAVGEARCHHVGRVDVAVAVPSASLADSTRT